MRLLKVWARAMVGFWNLIYSAILFLVALGLVMFAAALFNSITEDWPLVVLRIPFYFLLLFLMGTLTWALLEHKYGRNQ